MQCPKCQSDNPDKNKFCSSCGTPFGDDAHGEIYTEEESKDLFDRKNFAIEKIYESKPQRGIFLTLVLWLLGIGVSSGSLYVLGYLFIDININHPYLLSGPKAILFQLLGPFIVCLVLFGTLVLFSFLIQMSRRIKLFDLMSDRIEIVKRNDIRFSILFSDIESMSIIYYGKKGIPSKLLYKTADKYISMKIPSVTFTKMRLHDLKLGPGYVLGVGPGEVIKVTRKSGYAWSKILLPWRNTFENSRGYELHVSEPREFFDQLCVAYDKWKRTNVQ